MGFVKSAAKKSLLALTKKGELTPRFWARFFEAFVTRDELITFADSGAVDHGLLDGLTGDDHTQYYNSARHTALSHSFVDHGGLTGIGDDDHALYLLASDATSRVSFASNWIDLTDAGDTTLHGHDVTGLTNWPTVNYAYVTGNDAGTDVAAAELEELSDGSDTSLHIHDSIYYTKTETVSITTILADGTSAPVTVNLPEASTVTGYVYNIKAINIANAVTLSTFGTEQIDGSSSDIVLTLMKSLMIQSDGSNWWIL